MLEPARATLNAFPNSPYAAELQRGASGGSFRPELEAEFVRVRLRSNRTVVRVVAALALVLSSIRGADQILNDAWTTAQFSFFLVSLVASLALCAVAWSPWFEKIYLAVAHVVVPFRNALVAMTIASTLAQGQLEASMFLPLLVIGPFFFLGLSFRAALATVALTCTVYVAAALVFGMAAPLLLRTCLHLLLGIGASSIVARHLEQESRRSFLERHLIAELAQHDPLTGLKNRRVFDENLEHLWKNAVAEMRSMAVLLIDVDHFKAYNDLHGHQAGDRALRRVAQALLALVVGPHDVIGRYGGEEFAVILYDVDGETAETLAQRMRRAVSELPLEDDGHTGGRSVTISIGVAAVEPSRERRSRGALQLADQALYEAKVRGRNRVTLMDQAAHRMLKTGVFAKISSGSV